MMHHRPKDSQNIEREGPRFLPSPQHQPSHPTHSRPPTPEPSPETRQHDLYWHETVLHWNRSDYRWCLIEYMPCLLGIIWEEETLGSINHLTALPINAQCYFVRKADSEMFGRQTAVLSYHTIFHSTSRADVPAVSGHQRRQSEPEIPGVRLYDPEGITQTSWLFCRFLQQVLKTTKISCTALILALKFAHVFCRQRRVSPASPSVMLHVEDNQFVLFVTSLLLADKYTEDHPYTNKAWSTLSGVPIATLNRMECEFLAVLGHELYVSESDFRQWTKTLQMLCQWNLPNAHYLNHMNRIKGAAITDAVVSTRNYRRSTLSQRPHSTSVTMHKDTKSDSTTSAERPSLWSRFKAHTRYGQ